MTGYHEVKTFLLKAGALTLPEGWKPFAVYLARDGLVIVARKWHRS